MSDGPAASPDVPGRATPDLPGPGAPVPGVTADDIARAARLLDGVVRRTPVLPARTLSQLVGGPVLMKAENLQLAGSFKIRGAYVRLSRMPAEQRAAGVIAASAGNHAQGVALAAQLLGMHAVVVMPVGAPLPKLQATRSYGAEVRLHGDTVDEALVEAGRIAAETGATLVHPFDHVDIVAGQGTVGLEILDQVPQAATIVVGTGGGGLLAGIAVAVKAVRPDLEVIGVQAEGAAAYPASLAAGHPVALSSMSTMADGIAVGRPGAVPFALVRRLVDDVVTVSEEAISRALLLMLERGKLVVEPAGVVAVAALLDAPHRFRPPAVAVLSGGNIDPLLLLRVIQHGMASAGRYLAFRVRMKDRPGALLSLLGEIAEARANVITVDHARTRSRLRVDEVEVSVQVETRGPEHSELVLTRLRDAGLSVTFG